LIPYFETCFSAGRHRRREAASHRFFDWRIGIFASYQSLIQFLAELQPCLDTSDVDNGVKRYLKIKNRQPRSPASLFPSVKKRYVVFDFNHMLASCCGGAVVSDVPLAISNRVWR
jgi:hypothetical protein